MYFVQLRIADEMSARAQRDRLARGHHALLVTRRRPFGPTCPGTTEPEASPTLWGLCGCTSFSYVLLIKVVGDRVGT
jgi:hypothetical protein